MRNGAEKSQKLKVLLARRPRRGLALEGFAGAGRARSRVVVVDMVLFPSAVYPKSFFSSRLTALSALSRAASGSPPLRTESAKTSSSAVIMAWVQPMLSKWPNSLKSLTPSAALPDLSLVALAAMDLRGGMWKPYEVAQASWYFFCSIHSHFPYSLAASRFLPLALTNIDQPPL